MKDNLTLNLKKSTDIMFVKNPVGTSMGIFAGIAFHGILSLFAPALEAISIIRLAAIKWFHLVAIGIFGFNIKGLLTKRKYPEEVDDRIKLIEDMQNKGRITQSQANLMYHKLVTNYVDSVKLDDDFQAQTEAMKQSFGIQ